MAKFNVNCKLTKIHPKALTVHAKDEEAAKERVVQILDGWNDVVDYEIVDVEEIAL